ncbi:MAG: metallophosphoesterase [Bacteroidales bacterium]|nr:metallophosphoesterase [Bacteroidales bacterium]
MKTSAFVIFFTIVIGIYSLINYYIYLRGLQCTTTGSSQRLLFKIAFISLSVSYLFSRFLERIFINQFTNILSWIGAFWLGAMVYFLLFIIFIDLLRLLNSYSNFFPTFITANFHKTKIITFFSVSFIVIILIITGYINTINTRVQRLEIKISKKIGTKKSLNIIAVSDIHLGTQINKRRATYLVDNINVLKPDIILLAGDIVDEILDPVIKYNIGDILNKLKAPLGVYAITGNHEYIGGIANAAKYITEHNITLLRDTTVLIDNSFYLAGREDRDKERFTGKARKELPELLAGINKELPLILLDHQPFNLDKAAENNVDLQISGHTHNAQLFPFNYLAEKIYELSWGYKKKGNTHFYISCGFGTWGPPMRLGSRSEIVEIKIIN